MTAIPTLFLDIDGVLNPGEWIKTRPGRHVLSPTCCTRLYGLLQNVKPELILSSTWRRFTEKQDMEEILKNAGCPYPITGYTPYSGEANVMRGDEISEWLKAHPEPRAVAILDDDSDMRFLSMYLVKTDGMLGLQDEHIPKLKALLTS